MKFKPQHEGGRLGIIIVAMPVFAEYLVEHQKFK